MEQKEYIWSPPLYDLSNLPALVSSTRLPNDEDFPENFMRSAKWCPDGSSVLAQCENRSFQLFDLPPELLDSTITHAEQSLKVRNPLAQPSPILDFAWYPQATSKDPASYCFVASVRECPVKLLDAADGRLRASYRIVDHRERQIAPHSLAFNLGNDKLYCGFEDAIEIFDVHRPGEGSRLHTRPNKKSKEGVRGIISALAFSTSSPIYAAGSLTPPTFSSPNIALFSEEGTEPVMFVSVEDVTAGVTQLAFNPLKPHILYAMFRREHLIYSWDLRGNAGKPIRVFNQASDGAVANGERWKSEPTNQKMRFDIDLSGRWLGIGDQNGIISIFDLDSMEGTVEAAYSEDIPESTPEIQFRGGNDAIGSVGFHPLNPVLLSVSGSRHFPGDDDDGSGSDEESETEVIRRREHHPVTLDSSVMVWSFGHGLEGLR